MLRCVLCVKAMNIWTLLLLSTVNQLCKNLSTIFRRKIDHNKATRFFFLNTAEKKGRWTDQRKKNTD